MKIAIMGDHALCEKILEQLIEYEKELFLIDPDEEFCKKISEKFGIPTLVGDYTQKDFLKTIDLDEFDIFFVLGKDDKENLTASLLLKEMGGKNVTILLEDDDYLNIAQNNGINVILLRDMVLEKILEILYKIEKTTKMEEFYISKIEASEGLIGKRVFEIKGNGDKFFIFAIKRENIILYPDSETTVREGDILYYVTRDPHFSPGK